MNRQGQPARPPNLSQNPTLTSQFRATAPYPSPYGMPPRSVMTQSPFAPLQQASRTQPPATPIPQTPFRTGQSNYNFSLQASPASATTIPSTLQASSNGLPTSAALSQQPPSVSSASEVGLDPSDFPALGTAAAQNASASATGNGASYAQAGTTAPTPGPIQQRDFTLDDFPALGGVDGHAHPPGLGVNGFSNGGGQATPGMLNLAARGLGLPDTEKSRNTFSSLKLNQQQQAQSPAAAWNSSPSAAPAIAANANPSSTHPQQPQANGTHPATQAQSYTTNGTHPTTPAQQILVSAADRWGLLGLLLSIKNAGQDADGGLTAIGTDLGTMGMDMAYTGDLYSTFITPWADQSAARSVEPDFHLPACYNVTPPAPGPAKVAAFSDETLFFMFYSSPRDALQEVAAQELWNRNWRFHKNMRLWITKETGMIPSQKVPGGETGQYHVWDVENWCKERRDMTVLYNDLEEKSGMPAFLNGTTLHLANPPPTIAPVAATPAMQQALRVA